MTERRKPKSRKGRRKSQKAKRGIHGSQTIYRKGKNTIIVTRVRENGEEPMEFYQEMPTKDYEALLKEGR